MPLKDNEIDQLFRDRLRHHSSPVRVDLWRRIHTRLGALARNGAPFRPHHFLRHWRYLGVGAATVTVALAAHLIRAPHGSSHPPVNHYSTISAATDKRPDSMALLQTLNPGRTQPAAPAPVAFAAEPGAPAPGAPAPFTSLSLPHPHYSVTLPAIARLTIPATRTLRTIPTHNPAVADRSKPLTTLHPRTPFHPYKYISVYGSPDLPNKDYNFSWTVGARITFQLARHWSITTGFQYEQLNVPMADVGGAATMPFHFSDYSIPLLAGYINSFGQYNLTVTGGILFNVSSKVEGPGVRSPFGVPMDRNGNTAFIGVDVERPVANRWAVFIQPYLREQIFNSEIYLPSKTITNGVLIGGRYRL